MLVKETEYRKIKALHYSALKTFDNNQMKFYREYELGKKEDMMSMSYDMIMGSLIDCLLLEPKEFDRKFKIASCLKPTGQYGDFIDTLYSVTLQYVNENNEITESLKNRMDLAFSIFKQNNPTKFKGKDINYIIENFNKKDKDGVSPADYFEECLGSFGKTVIDAHLFSRAEKIVDSVKYGKYTNYLFKEDPDTEIFYQQGVIFNYLGETCKALHDRIEVNHKLKTIESFDLKSTWNSDGFDYSFKKFGYYLQGGLYYKSLEQFKRDKGLTDYTIIENFNFIVCDTSMEFLPHIWVMNKELIQRSLDGFEDKLGIRYNGVNKIIENIQFCRNIGSFQDNINIYNNNGKINIEI